MKEIKRCSLLFLFCSFLCSTGFASGFYLPFSSAAQLGSAYAGAGVMANDPSTAYTNPAALTLVKHKELEVGTVGVDAGISYTGSLTIQMPYPHFLHVPDNGNQVSGLQGGEFGAIPSGFFALPVNKRLVLAVGITLPYGLGINFGDVKPVSYAIENSAIYDLDLVPAFGFKISPQWSFGAGLDVQYFHLDSQTELPVVTILKDNLTGGGTYSSSLYDYGLGWHTGILYRPNQTFRFGLNFHAPQDFTLHGKDQISGSTNPADNKTGTAIKCFWHLPWVLSLYGSEQVDPNWSVLLTVSYSGWSRFKNIIYQNQTVPLLPPQNLTVPQDFKNAWDAGLGANYRFNRKWMFRMGVGYDESPTNPTYQQLWMVINDTIAAAAGFRYTVSKHCLVDLGYTHSWMKTVHFNNPVPVSGNVPLQSIGYANDSVNLYALQINWIWS